METDLQYGEIVFFPISSVYEARGTVLEVYGIPPNLYVVLELTPEVTGEYVDERTTTRVSIAKVRRPSTAA